MQPDEAQQGQKLNAQKLGAVRRIKVTYDLLLVISEACERKDKQIISFIFSQPFPIFNTEHYCPTHVGHSGAAHFF